MSIDLVTNIHVILVRNKSCKYYQVFSPVKKRNLQQNAYSVHTRFQKIMVNDTRFVLGATLTEPKTKTDVGRIHIRASM